MQLKIIEAQVNTCARRRILSGLFFMFCVCKVISSYFCVSHATNLLRNVKNLVFPCIFVESMFCVLFSAGMCGMLNQKSKIMLNQLKFNSLTKVLDRKLLYKRVCGYSQIKIKFGSNFVDILTPLKMMVLCIQSLVRLLLLR